MSMLNSSVLDEKVDDEAVNILLEKMFRELDIDNNQRFSKQEFPKVIRILTGFIGGELPVEDDVFDLFNLLDVNGDNSLDKNECRSLFKTFFKILK